MFQIIATIACVLVIGDYALKLGRLYAQRRNLRLWQKRVITLERPPPLDAANTSKLALPPISKWRSIALVAFVIAVVCVPAADHGKTAAKTIGILAGGVFWSIILIGLLRRSSKSKHHSDGGMTQE